MAGFSSYADFIDKTVNKGQMEEFEFTLTTANAGAGTAGVWQDMISASPGGMLANFTGTAGAAIALNSSTGGINIPINSDVSPQKRYLMDLQLSATAATFVPGTAYLCDFLLCYPNITLSPTVTLDNTVTLPRYTDGVGVMGVVTTTTTLNMNAAPYISIVYKANDDTTVNGSLICAQSATAPVSQLFNTTGTALKPGSPFMPLFDDKKGIKSISSYKLYTAYTVNGGSIVSILLVKPLMQFSITAASVSSEKDLFMQFPSFVEIKDGACLGLLVCPGGALVANSILRGRIRYGWG